MFYINCSAETGNKNAIFLFSLDRRKGIIFGPFSRLRRRNIDNRSVRSSIFVSKIAVRIHLVVNAVGIACLLDNTLCLRYRNRVYDQQERAGNAQCDLAFAKSTGVTYPLGLDPGADIFAKYALRESGITRNVLIDKEGKIVKLTRLYNEEEFASLVQAINEMLK